MNSDWVNDPMNYECSFVYSYTDYEISVSSYVYDDNPSADGLKTAL